MKVIVLKSVNKQTKKQNLKNPVILTRLIRFTTTNKIVTATLKLKLLSQSSKCLSRPNTSQMVAAHHLSLHHQVLSGRSGILSFRFFRLTAFNLHLRANPSPSQPEQPLTHDSRNPIGSDRSKLVDSGPEQKPGKVSLQQQRDQTESEA